MEGFNLPPAPSDNSVFVCTDEPAQEVGEVSQRAPRKRVWQAAFDDSQEMRLADKHSLACDEQIQEIVDRAKALYANGGLDILIKEEADIEGGVNVSDSLDGVNLKSHVKTAIGIFFNKFYTDLENSIELVEKFKECRREEEKVELQLEVEELTLTFKEADVFSASLDFAKMIIKDELPRAKEYLRGRKLTDADLELVEEMDIITIEVILVHVICTLYTPERTKVRIANLIEQIERAVRTHAGLMRNQRFQNIANKSTDKKKGDDTNLVVDSNILTDRSLDEPAPLQEILKINKKEKRYPIGAALVEMLEEKGVIEMILENHEGVKVKKKQGQYYYSKKAVLVSLNYKLEDLPLKINLPMVCEPQDWEPINPKRYPKTLADLKGGYLTGRTANISDRYNLLSSKSVKHFNVILNENYRELCSVMNTLQRQAFKINREHLKYIKENYQLLVNCNMLQPRFLCNVNTKYIAEVLKKAFLNDPDIKNSVSFSFILTLLLTNIDQARYEKFILDMAEAFLGYDFYMSSFIDFRGRIYHSGILNFHERDLARSLIIFSDPKYQKGFEIDKILATAAAFHFKSFKSTVEAQEWCNVVLMHVLKRIRESNEKKVWGENLDTHILDEFDALASAFEIISYFLLDETMAKRTNLIPDEKGRLLDIYSSMREELLEYMKERVSTPLLYDTVSKQLTRKVVKSVYMPKIYGKAYKTTRDDLANQIGMRCLQLIALK
ncbi:DNA-dependent RNA polymerase [Tanacetum coccineum]